MTSANLVIQIVHIDFYKFTFSYEVVKITLFVK